MAIPNFQEIMRPMLQLADEKGERHLRLFCDELATMMNITTEERAELLPSGNQSRFDNRVHWAASYLARAGLLERPARGTYRITDAGRTALASAPKMITAAWLALETEAGNGPTIESDQALTLTVTPEERLENSYQELRSVLAKDLLDHIKERTPSFFERLVVDLLVAMGYGGSLADAGRAIGRSGDGGIDGIIKEDRLGLDFIYIQAKRWENTVQSPAVQAFAGSLQGHHASKGVFITTSTFSKGARDFAARINTRIVLIDGQELAQLMIDHGVGVSTVTTYAVKRVDAEYFEG